MREDIHKLFHELWTKDVGTPGYEKAKWLQLEQHLNSLSNYCDRIDNLCDEMRHYD